MRFRPLLTFDDDVFPSEFHADITLDTIACETSASWPVFVTNAPAKRTPTITPLAAMPAIIISNVWKLLLSCYCLVSLIYLGVSIFFFGPLHVCMHVCVTIVCATLATLKTTCHVYRIRDPAEA